MSKKTDNENEEIHFIQIQKKIQDFDEIISMKFNNFFEKQNELDNKFNQQINSILEKLIKNLQDRNIDLKTIYEDRKFIEEESNKSKEFQYMIFNYLKENRNVWKH